MLLKKVLSFIFILMLSTAASAQMIRDKQVSRIYPSGGVVYFSLHDDTCATGNGYYYLPSTKEVGSQTVEHPDFKSSYSLLMAAATTAKPISVRVSSCPSQDSNVQVNYIFQNFK